MRATRKSRRRKRESAIAQCRLPLGPPTRPRDVESLDTYDATDDFSRSVDDCYAAIRERVAAGGKRWEPP
jgi:hypothetical protein